MISAVQQRALALRGCALLGAAALAVHELRYLAGWGAGAEHALASHGHSYLDSATPAVLLLLTVSLGAFLARLARGGGPYGGRRLGFWRLWLLASLALLAIYTSQELIEGALTPGHPSGLDGVFGTGGWTAVPLAGLFGALVALLLRGAEAVLARVAARGSLGLAAPVRQQIRPGREVLVRVRGGLARHLAGRAPPVVDG